MRKQNKPMPSLVYEKQISVTLSALNVPCHGSLWMSMQTNYKSHLNSHVGLLLFYYTTMY